jgi:hypothetical protein
MTLVTVGAQQERLPTARLVSAPRLAMPGAVDSNVPMTWEVADPRVWSRPQKILKGANGIRRWPASS